MKTFTVLDRTRVFSGFQSLDQVTVEIEDEDGGSSHQVTRLVLERGDAVGVLIREIATDQLIFVRQFRAPLIGCGEPWLTEIVAGMIDAGESPEETAVRETEEEIGYKVTKLEPLCQMYSSPGGSSEKLHLFYSEVSDSEKVGNGGGVDDHEDIEIVKVPRPQALGQLADGVFRDAKTQLAILTALRLGFLEAP